ncbi:AmmeMemoRadiSam system radical SAM enzyme [Candidatus Desantisbacteria bacterium]|nr:AmmeMemoRadiSam system radical SAM enzyme [Candidatus Desantisbacteria bacterium]
MKEADYYQKLKDDKVKCILCPHECVISPDKSGICRTRKNIHGSLFAMNYKESATSPQLDPVEKKPLYHFHPGKNILSLGPNSCNLQCQFCQNWTISQKEVTTQHIEPEELISSALKNSMGIAYTYSEPFTWYEFIMDIAPKAREKGLKNVLVTNGFINEEPLKKIIPYIDALNIDIKSMNEDFYLKVCKGRLSSVLKTCEIAKKYSWVEITNLIIPTLNDNEEEISKLVDWVAEKLGDETPLHFSKYFPQYKLAIPETKELTLKNAYLIAKNKLKYVYVGNIHIPDYSNTYCPFCNNLLIKREGYNIEIKGIENSRCNSCKNKVDVII